MCWCTWQGCFDSQGALVASSSFMAAWDTAHTELCTCVCVWGGGGGQLKKGHEMCKHGGENVRCVSTPIPRVTQLCYVA